MGRIKRIFNRFLFNIYHKLWVQIAAALIIIISIPVIFLGLLLLNNSQRALKNSVLAGHKQIVVRAAREISMFLEHSLNVLNTTAGMLGTIKSDSWRQETVLVGLALDNPIFIRITSFDLSAKKIAGSDLGRSFSVNYTHDALQEILAGKIYMSQVKLQSNNYMPYLTMAVALKEKSKVVGILAADIDFRTLWEIVDEIRLNNTGRAFLVSNEGVLIAHPDKKRVLKNESLSGQKDVDAVLSGRNDAIALADATGKKWISAYAPIGITGWGLILRQEQAEAYLFSRLMRLQLLVIMLLAGIIAILTAIVAAHILARPIKALVSKIKGACDSNNIDTINLKRYDEIGELIKLFNELSDKLKKAKAREKFSTIGEAAIWVAHELKNSLVPIKSFVQLLPLKHSDDRFIDKFSDVVPQEIKRCERMLKELSDFSAAPELKTDKIDIKEIMDSVLKMMQDKFIEWEIKVQFLTKNSGLNILGDLEKIKQAFTNLIINAIDAMPKGGNLDISIELLSPAHKNGLAYLEVNICDTGIGISEERLKNIFEPFRTTKKDGMGLGLAISRRIVEQYKGDIQVHSVIGKGTSFKIKFPAFPAGL